MATERFLLVHTSFSFPFYVMSSSCSFATESKIELLHEKCWYFWSAQKKTQHVTAHISYKIFIEFTGNLHIGAHNLASTFQFQESEVVSLKWTFKTFLPFSKKSPSQYSSSKLERFRRASQLLGIYLDQLPNLFQQCKNRNKTGRCIFCYVL